MAAKDAALHLYPPPPTHPCPPPQIPIQNGVCREVPSSVVAFSPLTQSQGSARILRDSWRFSGGPRMIPRKKRPETVGRSFNGKFHQHSDPQDSSSSSAGLRLEWQDSPGQFLRIQLSHATVATTIRTGQWGARKVKTTHSHWLTDSDAILAMIVPIFLLQKSK